MALALTPLLRRQFLVALICMVAIVVMGCGKSAPNPAVSSGGGTPPRADVARMSQTEAAQELEERGYVVTRRTHENGNGVVIGVATPLPGAKQTASWVMDRREWGLLARCPEIESLHLRAASAQTIPADTISALHSLERIVVEAPTTSDGGLRALWGLPYVASIRVVDAVGVVTDELLQALTGFSRLREVDLSEVAGTRLTAAAVGALSGRQLQRLELPQQLCRDDMIAAWIDVHGGAGAIAIDGRWTLSEQGVARLAEAIRDDPRILTLRIDAPSVTTALLSHFEGLNLIDLLPPVSTRDDDGLKTVLSAIDPAARKGIWNLADWAVTDASVALLAKRFELVSLNLAGTRVTDEAVRSLAGHDMLQQLSLENTAIHGDSLDCLAACKNLKFLDRMALPVAPLDFTTNR